MALLAAQPMVQGHECGHGPICDLNNHEKGGLMIPLPNSCEASILAGYPPLCLQSKGPVSQMLCLEDAVVEMLSPPVDNENNLPPLIMIHGDYHSREVSIDSVYP